MKGLIEWIYEMVVGIMEYAAKELVGVMSMDMAYFEQTAPVIKDITNIILALGWGMLIANMVFQSTKAMMSGVGFESEAYILQNICVCIFTSCVKTDM